MTKFPDATFYAKARFVVIFISGFIKNLFVCFWHRAVPVYYQCELKTSRDGVIKKWTMIGTFNGYKCSDQINKRLGEYRNKIEMEIRWQLKDLALDIEVSNLVRISTMPFLGFSLRNFGTHTPYQNILP